MSVCELKIVMKPIRARVIPESSPAHGLYGNNNCTMKNVKFNSNAAAASDIDKTVAVGPTDLLLDGRLSRNTYYLPFLNHP